MVPKLGTLRGPCRTSRGPMAPPLKVQFQSKRFSQKQVLLVKKKTILALYVFLAPFGLYLALFGPFLTLFQAKTPFLALVDNFFGGSKWLTL